MNECSIVNVGISQWYERGSQRLARSLEPYVGADLLTWDELPSGSPPHAAVPYAFKPWAMLVARARGHRYVLWCDSAVWAIRSPMPIFDAIARDGYFITENGFRCGEWITDAALQLMGLTRDGAFEIPDYSGCCFGLDMVSDIGREFFTQYLKRAQDGSFCGDWKNDRGQCSADPRCKGHRHDQVVGSIIAHRLGMKFNREKLFRYYVPEPEPSVCLLAQGM